MDLKDAKIKTRPRPGRKRVGRGEGSGYGKTCGRGMNGARSRSGWSERNMTGGNIPLWRRLPKVGFTNGPFKKEYAVVNVKRLSLFESGDEVTPQVLREKGILKGQVKDGVKVLGEGEIEKSLTVHAHSFSRGAREKIEAAGGSCEVIPGPRKPVRNKMKQRSSANLLQVEESEAQ